MIKQLRSQCRCADDMDKEQNAYGIKSLEPELTRFAASSKESKQTGFKKPSWQTPTSNGSLAVNSFHP